MLQCAAAAATSRARSSKAGRLQEIFGRDNLFVELQDHGLPAQRDTNPQADRARPQASAPRCSPPTTRTTPTARTTRPTTRCCACRPARCSSDPKRFKFEGQEHYLKSADEMRYLFREVPEACDNTLWIAERADVDDRVRQAAAARLPAPRRLRRRRRVPRATSRGRGPRARWGDELPPTSCERLALRARRSSRRWASARTS